MLKKLVVLGVMINTVVASDLSYEDFLDGKWCDGKGPLIDIITDAVKTVLAKPKSQRTSYGISKEDMERLKPVLGLTDTMPNTLSVLYAQKSGWRLEKLAMSRLCNDLWNAKRS